MDDLSEQSLMTVLLNLSLAEIFNYRKVSVKFRDVIDRIRFKKLTLFFRQYPFNLAFFYTRETLNLKRALKISNLDDFLNSKIIQSSFKNIKKLYIYSYPVDLEDTTLFDIAHLNKFKNLEQLETNRLNFIDGCKLKLPHLKYLCIVKLKKGIIEIRAPCLTHFKTINLNQFEFVSHQLTYLQCVNLDFSVKNYNKLEFLASFFIDYGKVPKDFIKSLPNLKHLVYIQERFVGTIFRKRISLDLNEMKIYQSGIPIYLQSEIRTSKHTHELTAINEQSIDHYYKNYYDLSPIVPFVDTVNFNELIKKFHKVPQNFHSKFIEIKSIIVNLNVPDQNELLKFIFDCKNLSILKVEFSGYSRFDQTTIDKLPEVAPNLLVLTLGKHPSIDLDFTFRLINLEELEMDLLLDLDYIVNLFKSNKYMKFIQFISTKENVYELKKSRKFELEHEGRKINKSDDVDSMVIFLKNYDSNLE